MRKLLLAVTALAGIAGTPTLAQPSDVVLRCVFPGALSIRDDFFDLVMNVAIKGGTATITADLFAGLTPGTLEVDERPSVFIIKLKSKGGEMLINRIDGSTSSRMSETDTPMVGSCTRVETKF